MSNMFSNESRQFKFDILVNICRQAFAGEVREDEVNAYARNLVSLDGPRYRCCVYKEREILRQRVRLAMGKMAREDQEPNPRQIIHVIDAACDGCTIKKIRVTDNCRKCMAKSCLAACRFGAISIGSERSEIDYSKCKECGACSRACPYNAIVVTERPCYAHCPVQAISWNDQNIAVIDEKKCINCGQCESACPFGAIEDISWVVPVIKAINMGAPIVAVVAPSIQGQFDDTSIPQVLKSVEMLGFKKCIEVAVGADAVAEFEYEELVEHKKTGKPMTTSCCPGFVNMLRIHFPKLYAENKSTTVTPMEAIARQIKRDHPDYGVVFIGPCLAKKQEAMEDYSVVDYVLTYEELAAMLISKGINPAEVEAAPEEYPSVYGRNFAFSGGVAAAVAEAAKEHNDGPYTAFMANGAIECKKQLQIIQAGKFNFDILEGMCCPGGCIAGPACISDAVTVKGRMAKENLTTDKKTIQRSLEIFSFENVDMEVGVHQD
ncbi:MAG: monomeric [Solobacterium sp.]|nr:monomeric [FeFe] hydrogenase [Solobacterium sp.]